MSIYLQGNGLPCYKPATGGIYLWSQACCVDCDACVERKDRGEWNANSPYGYKCEFTSIDAWAGEDEHCSQSNCRLYNLSYVVQANNVLPPGSCNWIKKSGGGFEPHPPDVCSVPNAGGRYVEIVMSYTGGHGLITVTYRWGSAPDEIVYTKTYPGTRVPCLELTAEDIDYVSYSWESDEFCDPTGSHCELTDL